MIDLDEEAAAYDHDVFAYALDPQLQTIFKDGANSKYSKFKVIEAQINLLYEIRNGGFASIEEKIESLESELLKLEASFDKCKLIKIGSVKIEK